MQATDIKLSEKLQFGKHIHLNNLKDLKTHYQILKNKKLKQFRII